MTNTLKNVITPTVAPKNNGATVVKTQPITQPEYTADNFYAQLAWNKEIANNKQGYMAVDIMSMKDFYDAGGYSFVDDYRAEVASADAAYDRALPGYGVRGEQMAGAGLTGSGFGDYLSGQAYAARVGGQALARQNAMANSNSFRAAYNQYVQQQLQKRETNLQTVVDKAYAAGTRIENFVDVATKLGIPQADAERGKVMLEAYYSYGQGGYYKNTTDETGANNAGYTIEDLTTEDRTTASSLANYLVAAMTGGEYENAEGEMVQLNASSADAALAQLEGSYDDRGGVITEAARNQATKIFESRIQSAINQGGYVSKEEIDAFATNGGFGAEGTESEAYKSLLEKVQEENFSGFATAAQSGLTKDYIAAISKAGYETADIDDENATERAAEILDAMAENGDISEAEYHSYFFNEAKYELDNVHNKTDFQYFASTMINDKERIGVDGYNELLDGITVSLTGKKETRIVEPLVGFTDRFAVIKMENGQVVQLRYSVEPVKSAVTRSKDKPETDSFSYADGKIYMRSSTDGKMYRIRISQATDAMEQLIVEKLKKSN